MFLFCIEDMLYTHLNDETKKQIQEKKAHQCVFENMLTGQNLISLEIIQVIADKLLTIPEKTVKLLTRKMFIENYLQGEDFIDATGRLV